MPRGNGGVLGPANIPTTSVAKGVWSLMEQQLAQQQGIWPVGPLGYDPYFEYTTLLLPGNGTNGAQNNTFLDGSTNNFTITRNGNTTQGTFSPFSQTGWGNYFDGSSSVLTTSTSIFSTWSTANASTTTATIEAMVYVNALQSAPASVYLNPSIISKGATYLNFSVNSTGNIVFYHYDGSGRYLTSSGTIQTNTWNYVAVTITGGTATIYINGTSSGSGTWYGIQTAGLSTSTYIGQTVSGQFWNGYISNLRVSSIVRTIATPLLAYTDDGNTSFLTCQSNRFKDNSTNNYTITPSGSARVVAFSPFNPSASWSAATYGGSGYFDGNTDYLTVPQSAGALDLGSGQFSLEFWWYPTSVSGTIIPFIGDSTGNWYVGQEAGNIVLGRRATAIDVNTTGFTLVANTWQHIVVTRQSTSTNDTRIFVNGVLRGVGTTSQNYTITTTLNIGGLAGGYVTGYLSSTNLVKGSVPAAYQTSSTTTGTQIFTPPTSPSTSVTGTQLLLNYTNAGIYDATSKNDLETVGDAQISTAQSKWGGSSMAFDGNNDSLNGPSSTELDMGTGNWTVEGWINITTRTLNYPLIIGNNNGGFSAGAVAFTASNADSATYNDRFNLAVYDLGGTRVINATGTANATGTWYHFAVVRNGTNISIYRDGVSVASATVSSSLTINFGKNGVRIGGNNWDSAQSYLNGYLQDLRITKGYARYTSNFTPPTAAFPTL